MRHLLTLFDLTSAEIQRIFTITEDLKTKYEQGLREPLLPGRVMALLFDKPSLRTRVSFEAAMTQLGGNSMFLGADVGWGKRESIADFARVLSQYVDVIVCRTTGHERIEQLAAHAECSVINGLTDSYHPCQALADLYTMRELFGEVRGRRLAYVGDANNVARSLAICCAKLGAVLSVAAPAGYGFEDEFLARLRAACPENRLELTEDPREAVRGADCVYTDVWTSMGQESEAETRRSVFAPYQVNEELMALSPGAKFLHCLPAHRGEEVTDAVIDGPDSLVVRQAGNRMHAQRGLLAWLLGAKG